MAKERIYLTDITMHTRGYRQTTNFSKVAEKGRMYSPLPEGYEKNIETKGGIGTFQVSIELPPDLKERLERGEVEIMVPEDGLPVYAGKDVYDLLGRMRREGNRADVQDKWGAKYWRDKKKGV